MRPNLPASTREKLGHLVWLVEEFKVSCFAQELGTAVSVSSKKLDEALEELRTTAAG